MTNPLSARTVPRASIVTVAALLGLILSASCGSSTNAAIASMDDGGSSSDGYGGSNDDGHSLQDVGFPQDDGATDATAATDGLLGSDGRPLADYVNLGTAASFVVLAGETVTNTGFTVITGDVGISPGSAITGFPPGIVNGTIHISDAVAAKAKSDLNKASAWATAHSGTPVPLIGDLGGRTLPPGNYTSDTSMVVSSGNLTLDAGGNQDAIWVFEMATTFIIFVDRKVLLANNAKADNVFWNVGSSSTIGVRSEMVGNFLTQTSISVQTGATMQGRFLTQTGAVTFDSNIVNRPPPINY